MFRTVIKTTATMWLAGYSTTHAEGAADHNTNTVKGTIGTEATRSVEYGGFWGGFMGCSGLPATLSDGFGPWLVAGSLYFAPQHQAAHGMQMSVDTVSPSLRGYRCVHICCWPTFKILNLARERGL